MKLKSVVIFFLGLLVLSCEDENSLPYKDCNWLVYNQPLNEILFPNDTEGVDTYYWINGEQPSSFPDSVIAGDGNGNNCSLIHYYKSENRIEWTSYYSTELRIQLLDPSWSVEYQEK